MISSISRRLIEQDITERLLSLVVRPLLAGIDPPRTSKIDPGLVQSARSTELAQRHGVTGKPPKMRSRDISKMK